MDERNNDMGGMHFQEKLYKLFPEDLEKLKLLPEDQRADFLQKLHSEGRYTVVYNNQEDLYEKNSKYIN